MTWLTGQRTQDEALGEVLGISSQVGPGVSVVVGDASRSGHATPRALSATGCDPHRCRGLGICRRAAGRAGGLASTATTNLSQALEDTEVLEGRVGRLLRTADLDVQQILPLRRQVLADLLALGTMSTDALGEPRSRPAARDLQHTRWTHGGRIRSARRPRPSAPGTRTPGLLNRLSPGPATRSAGCRGPDLRAAGHGRQIVGSAPSLCPGAPYAGE